MSNFYAHFRLLVRLGILGLLLIVGVGFTGLLAQAALLPGEVVSLPQTQFPRPKSIKLGFPTYTILPVAGSGGSLVPGTPQTVNAGDSITFTVVPSVGHSIADVGVDGVSQGAIGIYVFANVTASHFITAAFDINTYLITPTVVGEGGGITPSGPQTVTHGSAQTFQFIPEAYYHVAGVWVDGLALGPVGVYTFTNITANHTLTATFAPDTFVITSAVTPTQWGTLAPLGPQTVTHASVLTFFITPTVGYMIADVLVDGASVGAVVSYTFSNITANHTLTATFAPLSYRLIPAVIGSGGTISPSGIITAYYGTTHPFYINPNVGYHIEHMGVDGSLLAVPTPVYTFANVNNNHLLTATFAVNTYTLTPTAGPNGSIFPGTPQTLAHGGNLTFTFTPNPNHHVDEVWVDGVAQGPIASYAFTNVTAHHTLSAAFAFNGPTRLTILVSNTNNVTGYVSYSGGTCYNLCSASFDYNSPVTLTASSERFKLVGWGGPCAGAGLVCVLAMTTSQTVTAYFGMHQVFLPFVQRQPPCVPAISEPNNSLAEAIGPLCSGQTYQTVPEDANDWFYFDMSLAGSVMVTMTNNNAFGVQLRLHDTTGNILGYTNTPPVFYITCANYINPNCSPGTPFPPGRYYIGIYASGNYTTTPYSLTVTYPTPSAP